MLEKYNKRVFRKDDEKCIFLKMLGYLLPEIKEEIF